MLIKTSRRFDVQLFKRMTEVEVASRNGLRVYAYGMDPAL